MRINVATSLPSPIDLTSWNRIVKEYLFESHILRHSDPAHSLSPFPDPASAANLHTNETTSDITTTVAPDLAVASPRDPKNRPHASRASSVLDICPTHPPVTAAQSPDSASSKSFETVTVKIDKESRLSKSTRCPPIYSCKFAVGDTATILCGKKRSEYGKHYQVLFIVNKYCYTEGAEEDRNGRKRLTSLTPCTRRL